MDHTYVPMNIYDFILHVKLFENTVLNIFDLLVIKFFCRFISFLMLGRIY